MKNDVENYIERRKRNDKAFAKDFDAGYAEFKIGVMLREAREQAGVTQEKLARITKTKKSAISRLENHAEDVRLSTVSRVARALGKAVRIELVEATWLRTPEAKGQAASISSPVRTRTRYERREFGRAALLRGLGRPTNLSQYRLVNALIPA